MVILFLNPFPVRGEFAPYLWIFYRLLSIINEKSGFILSQDYLKNPNNLKDLGRGEAHPRIQKTMDYDIKDFEKIKNHLIFSIPLPIWDSILSNNQNNPNKSFENLLTQPIYELSLELRKILQEIMKDDSKKIEAIVTWCNCPSLSQEAARLNIPLIHQELGPLRPPLYNELCYFDFQGVNGNTEAKEFYQNREYDLPLINREQLLTLFLQTSKPTENNKQYIGVVLQVEDDSNLIAFGNGWSNIALMDYVKSKYKSEEILVRAHPGSLFSLMQDKTDLLIDHSENAIDFIHKCKKIITINSSIGFEAILHGIETEILGEASFKFIIENQDKEEILKRINFYMMCYLIPKPCQLDLTYLRFRLEKPSLQQIFCFHLSKRLDMDMSNNINELASNLVESNNQLTNKLKQLNIQLYEKEQEITNLQLINDSINDNINKICLKVEELNNELEDQLSQKRQEIHNLQTTIQSLYSSRSWRLTKPLRYLGNKLRHSALKKLK